MDNLNKADLPTASPDVGGRLPGSSDLTGVEIPEELLLELLGETPEAQSGDSADAGEGDGPGEQQAPRKLDWSQKVSLPDDLGDATLGQLKDDAVAFRKSKAQANLLEQEREEFGNEKLRVLQELQIAVSSLGPEALNSEKLAPVREFYARQQQTEDRLLMTAVPEWQERKPDVEKFLRSRYGAPQGVLDTPAPAWARKALYDWYRMSQRLEGVVEKRKSHKAAASKRNPDTPGDRKTGATARSKATGDQIDQIVGLIGLG